MGTEHLSKAFCRLRAALENRDARDVSDADLLRIYVGERDEEAFAIIVKRHAAMVLGVCMRVLRNHADAQDAFQATFLVLIRKAATLRSPALLANWLYGVAFRTASEAKKSTFVRRAKEAAMASRVESSIEMKSELHRVLDLELERLPEKYRAVIVLCELEGKTRKEASKHLNWPEGTVAGRLSRGRTLLAKRLTKYGITLSAAALGEQLAESALASAVATTLLAQTMTAAAPFWAGTVAGEVVSAKVTRLAEGVLKAMLLTKLKIIAILAVALLALAGIGTGVASSYWGAAEAQVKAGRQNAEVKRDSVTAKPAIEKDKIPSAIWSQSIVQTYVENEALADEEFTGKTLNVSGHLVRVQRTGNAEFPYAVIMSPTGSIMSFHPVNMPSTPLVFLFGAEAVSQLARLQTPRSLTIQGLCYGSTNIGLTRNQLAGDLLGIVPQLVSDRPIRAIGFRACRITSASSLSGPQEYKSPTPPVVIARAFRDNDATSDELLAGKKMQIAGIMGQIQRNRGLFPESGKKSFLLLMVPGELQPNNGMPREWDGHYPIYFAFKEDSRKELATLKPGQRIAIEGVGMSKQALGEIGTFVLQDCKILKVEESSKK